MDETWMDYQFSAYERELDMAAAILREIHPAGHVKAIGRREVAAALRDVAAELMARREVAAALREAAFDVGAARARCRCDGADDGAGDDADGMGAEPTGPVR